MSDWDDDQDNNGDAVWIPVGGESVNGDGGDINLDGYMKKDGADLRKVAIRSQDGAKTSYHPRWFNCLFKRVLLPQMTSLLKI